MTNISGWCVVYPKCNGRAANVSINFGVRFGGANPKFAAYKAMHSHLIILIRWIPGAIFYLPIFVYTTHTRMVTRFSFMRDNPQQAPPPHTHTHTLAHKLERVLCISPIHDWPPPRTVRNSGQPSFTAPGARTERAVSGPRTQAGEHLFCTSLCVFRGETPGEHGENTQTHVTNSRNIAKRVRNHILGI